jgi:SHS2 domain-containing protein
LSPYRFFDHTADLGVEVTAPDLEGLFAEAGQALAGLVVAEGRVEEREERRIELTAENVADLFVAWLSELLYLMDAEGLVLTRFDFEKLTETSLCARARGERLDPRRHRPGREVKAITYHELLVEPTDQGWRARVILDI